MLRATRHLVSVCNAQGDIRYCLLRCLSCQRVSFLQEIYNRVQFLKTANWSKYGLCLLLILRPKTTLATWFSCIYLVFPDLFWQSVSSAKHHWFRRTHSFRVIHYSPSFTFALSENGWNYQKFWGKKAVKRLFYCEYCELRQNHGSFFLALIFRKMYLDALGFQMNFCLHHLFLSKLQPCITIIYYANMCIQFPICISIFMM